MGLAKLGALLLVSSCGRIGFDDQTSCTVDVVEVAEGGHHTCVRKSDSSVWCWGFNVHGQLGDGTVQPHDTPVRVPGVTAQTVVAGLHHTCALATDGTVSCWGDNTFGQLGTGGTANSL